MVVVGVIRDNYYFCLLSVSKMFMMNVPAEIVTQGVDVMLAVWFSGLDTVQLE